MVHKLCQKCHFFLITGRSKFLYEELCDIFLFELKFNKKILKSIFENVIGLLFPLLINNMKDRHHKYQVFYSIVKFPIVFLEGLKFKSQSCK